MACDILPTAEAGDGRQDGHEQLDARSPNAQLESSGMQVALLMIETYTPDALEKAIWIRW